MDLFFQFVFPGWNILIYVPEHFMRIWESKCELFDWNFSRWTAVKNKYFIALDNDKYNAPSCCGRWAFIDS